MKLKKILRRGGGGETKASSKEKSSTRSNNNHKNIPETDNIQATNTGSTASHSFDGSGGMVSDVPHGSGIYVDTKANNNDGATGFLNDVVVAIKTPRKMSQHNISNNSKEATKANQGKPPSKSKTSASASLPSLDFAEILQAGYTVLSCVAQCRPMRDATTTTEIPTVIDPALNEDHHTVGELTLLTIEREEHRREMISAAKDKAAEITAGIVGMGFTTTAATATNASPTTSGYGVSRQTTSMNSAAPLMHKHQRQQQLQPQHSRVHANIGSLLDGNHMQVKAQALLEKANSQKQINVVHHDHAVQMQHSVDDSASFNMPPVNADTVFAKQAQTTGETFIGRYGARPSLSNDDDRGDESSEDENECGSIDGQIGRW